MRNIKKHLSVFCAFAMLGGLFSACGPTETRRATGEYIDDTAVNARVKTALLRDDIVGGFDVSTTTYDGVVQLSGFVDTEEERRRAEEVAVEVRGVQRVENNISLTDRSVQYGERQDREDRDEDEEDAEAIRDRDDQQDEWSDDDLERR